PDARMKIMHASDTSPYLSPKAAGCRKGDATRNKWLASIQHARKQLALLRDTYGERIEVREHEEPFVWRLFLIDSTAYIQPYLFRSNNSDVANVLKVVRHE